MLQWQGVSSKHIRFDPRSESYVLDPALKLPTCVRDTVLSLCELGWLFSKVSSYCASSEGLEASKGLVVQAFGFALQVNSFYTIILLCDSVERFIK